MFDTSPRRQSTSMRNSETKQILENWLPTTLTDLKFHSLDVDASMEAKLNELKHFGNVPF